MRRLLFALYVMSLPATADVLQQFVAQDGIAGQFSQNILSPEGVVLDQSSGDFKLLKPHFFWWHITAPDNQLMVAADDRLTQIDWDLEVTVERQLSDSERSPFYWLLAPREALLGAFSLGCVRCSGDADASRPLGLLSARSGRSRRAQTSGESRCWINRAIDRPHAVNVARGNVSPERFFGARGQLLRWTGGLPVTTRVIYLPQPSRTLRRSPHACGRNPSMRWWVRNTYWGQGSHCGTPLRRAAAHSFILWGPPGVGKTTLARLVSLYTQGIFLQLSAVFSGIKDIRAAVEQARQAATQGKRAILFVDEVHRFNKSQQDAFLPHIEDGTICFVGATTENPSFEVNSALLSRLRVYRLRPVTADVLEKLLVRTVARFYPHIDVAPECLLELARLADGDVRQSLNLLELATDLCAAEDAPHRLDEAILKELASTGARRFDKGGDVFFDQISALHKAVRGSDPDASLYWFARMLDGGCDPLYIGRRCIRMASEDIGIADPRALQLALDAYLFRSDWAAPRAS